MRKEPLKITERTLDDILVLELDGDLALENNQIFRSCVTTAIEAGRRKLIVNLSGVEYMDSSGLGELVSCYTALRKRGGRFALLRLNARLQHILTITKLYTVFDVFDTEETAVQSLSLLSGSEKSFATASVARRA